jgi:hypothetical protein
MEPVAFSEKDEDDGGRDSYNVYLTELIEAFTAHDA